MINYSKESKLANIKYTLITFFHKHKVAIIIFGVLLVLALLTGIFTGIKLWSQDPDLDLDDFSLITLADGSIYSFKIFLLRYLSLLLIFALLLLFSINKALSIFAYILLTYRMFLLGLNCTLIIVFMGLAGSINAILIILPCQLLNIITAVLIFLIFRNMFKEKKLCGFVDKSKYIRSALILIGVALIINILEVLLLLLFKATTILII